MHAVVDDLSNYLGVPTVKGSGGNTKVYQFTAGQTWTLSPTVLMDQTFGFSRQKQDVLGPDFNAGNFGLDVLGIPGTNDQGIGDQRYAGYPEFQFGGTTSGFFSQLGNRDGWNPTTRLTLDLGLRWEVYPIMHRADGRGLDRLDLSNPDFARQLDVIVAGRGGNPQTNGMKAGLNNFAPRVGGTYRINDST